MAHWLIERIRQLGDRDCIVQIDQTFSYGDLAQEIDHSLRAFQTAGLQSGQIVALSGDYSIRGIAAFIALLEIQAIIVPIASISLEEAKERQREANALWIIETADSISVKRLPTAEAEPHDLIQQVRDAQSPGLILFSSGSTGRAKAMIHDAKQLLARFEKKRTRRHRILVFLLFDHIGGLNTLFNALATGACIIVPNSRDPDEVARAMASHGANLLPASPTFLNLLLISGATKHHDLSKLRFITYGTEPMPESLLKRIQQDLPNATLIQTFGTSETGISQTISRASDSTLIKFEDPNTEHKIVDGELWLRSQSQVLGYLNQDTTRFTPDGWFRTGDLVENENDGFLRIVGRRQDLINVGGEKVTPSEVESIILEMPEVADCMVYGEENAITGQNVAAKVVPSKEKTHPRELKRLIKNYCRERLSAYKVPARIRITGSTEYSERFKKMRHR
ncbi:MAG: class I adenylate-forming enzyme family protein [Coraliomargaritaceae bacterium]